VIFNGRPAQARGMGSEWGHSIADFKKLSVDDDATAHEVEGIASGTGLVRRARARGMHQIQSASQLAAAALDGDSNAIELFDDAAAALASLFYTLSMGFHPEVFAVSGGMLAIQELFLPKAIALYERAIRRHPGFATRVLVSKLGTRAGVIGAARLPRLK
jgi:glucokinase